MIMEKEVKKELLVFDNSRNVFRKLDKTNYDDDLVIGTVLLRREAVVILKKYFLILGYALIAKDGDKFPVDIQDDHISIFEGTYNCMPEKAKEELIEYNLTVKPTRIWSSFFFQWQFMLDMKAFENNGFFIKLCSEIMENDEKIEMMIEQKRNLVFPVTYAELCELAQTVSAIFEKKLINRNYYENFNYLMDSLLRGYHINMSKNEIERYGYQICGLMINKGD